MEDKVTTRINPLKQKKPLDIQEHLQFLANVVENNSQPFVVGYADGRIITCNHSFCELLGYTKEELSTMTWNLDLTPPAWRKHSQKMLAELCRTGQPQRYEKEYLRKDGSPVPLELFVHKANDPEGNIMYYSFYTDITERRQVDEGLRKQREHLEELVKERTYKLKAANEQLLREIAERMRAEQIIRESEERFRRITDKMLDMIRQTDAEGIIQYASPSHKNILGYEPEDLLGKSIFDFVHPGDKNRIMTIYKSNIRASLGGKEEYRFRHANGQYLHVSTYGNLLFDENGQIIGAVFCSRDITERKMAEEALRKSEARYRTIFENTGNATVIFGEDTMIYLVNTETEKLSGYSKEELEGKKSCLDFVAKHEFERILQYHSMRRIDPDAAPCKYELKFIDRKGNVKDILMTVAVIPGTKSYVASLLDITERKQLENELVRLERLNLVGEMAAGISHEMRNPMTTVRGFLQILRSKKDCAGYKQYFDLMIEELDRANSIIKEYLSLAKNKAVELRMQNLNNILEALFPLIQADAMVSDKYILLEMGNIPKLLLDQEEIRQLILNLVRNGLEAMSPGGSLTIRTFRDGEEVVIAVRDQGKGIEPDVLEKIGTPFFTTKMNGTGLGLAVCYSIAARHNAAIKVDTGPTGTTFNVQFKTIKK